MAKRALAALELPYWGTRTLAPYTVTKVPYEGRSVVKFNGLGFDEEEVRKIHAFLGKVIEDCDNGV